MDETTNDLLRQLVSLQQQTVENQKTILGMQRKAIKRNDAALISYVLLVAFFIAWSAGYIKL